MMLINRFVDISERFEVQIVRVADRRQHTAHIRADGHQCGHQYGLILLARHDKHRNSEWHERVTRATSLVSIAGENVNAAKVSTSPRMVEVRCSRRGSQ